MRLVPAAEACCAMGEWATPDELEGDITLWPDGYNSTFLATLKGDSVTMTRRDTGQGGHPGDITYTGKLDSATMVVEER